MELIKAFGGVQAAESKININLLRTQFYLKVTESLKLSFPDLKRYRTLTGSSKSSKYFPGIQVLEQRKNW